MLTLFLFIAPGQIFPDKSSRTYPPRHSCRVIDHGTLIVVLTIVTDAFSDNALPFSTV